jgi:Cdc6-like AAA superfamily ATPase
MTNQEKIDMRFKIGRVFTPGAPIDDRTLFAGRTKQLNALLNTITQRGQHGVLFGERGVGKTSLANIVRDIVAGQGQDFIVVSTNCETTSNFKTIWQNIFNEGILRKIEVGMGFNPTIHFEDSSFSKQLTKDPSPEEIRQLLEQIGKPSVVIIDEIDRITEKKTKTRLADTIKTLSDHSVDSTLILVGVADSIDQLMAEHLSIERALVQIHMPRMSPDELREIILNGLKKLTMTIQPLALLRISSLSHGLPHYAHLLALHAAQAAVDRDSMEVSEPDVSAAISNSITQAQQSIIRAYQVATTSARGNLYTQVLLACALAQTDEWGFFPATNVREPLSKITGKDYDIPAFAQHLKDFQSETRGSILQRTGFQRRYRYRFQNPLMEPYVVMKGLSKNLISAGLLDAGAKLKTEPSADEIGRLL